MPQVINWGITADDFIAPEAKALWDLLSDYYFQAHTQGTVLPPDRIRAWFPAFVLPDDMGSYTLEALCFEVRRERSVIVGNTALVKAVDDLKIHSADPMTAFTSLSATLSQLIALGTTKNSDVRIKHGFKAVAQEMRLRKSGVDTSVMSWPWEPLQQATMGLQHDDFVVFYGRPKSMKTWILVKLIAWAFEHERKIVVYTKEMTPTNVFARMLACVLRLEYSEVRQATTSPEDDARIEDLIQMLEDDAHLADLVTVLSGQDVPEGGDSVPWLRSKVEKYNPAVIYVDGMYLLSPSGSQKITSDEQRVRSISRALRSMVLATGVPCIATMQANRKAAGHKDANLDEIAYSDALAQDATIAIRVINDKASPTISLVLAGSREFELHGFRINARVAKDFSYHSLLTDKDVMQAKEGDAAEAPSPKSSVVRRPKNDTKKAEAAEDILLDKQIHAALG